MMMMMIFAYKQCIMWWSWLWISIIIIIIKNLHLFYLHYNDEKSTFSSSSSYYSKYYNLLIWLWKIFCFLFSVCLFRFVCLFVFNNDVDVDDDNDLWLNPPTRVTCLNKKKWQKKTLVIPDIIHKWRKPLM